MGTGVRVGFGPGNTKLRSVRPGGAKPRIGHLVVSLL